MVTIEQLIAEVRALAAAYPDAVYQPDDGQCRYNSGKVISGPEEEGCIFGQALRQLGMPYGGPIEQMAIGSALHLLEIRHTEDQLRWCSCAQSEQDNRSTWSKAVSLADEHHPLSTEVHEYP